MKYEILQLAVSNKRIFTAYSELTDEEKKSIEGYTVVYSGEIDPSTVTDDDYSVLEKLFTIFNNDHPADYKGRSLSVSDIVILDDTRAYYCDPFSWERVKLEK